MTLSQTSRVSNASAGVPFLTSRRQKEPGDANDGTQQPADYMELRQGQRDFVDPAGIPSV